MVAFQTPWNLLSMSHRILIISPIIKRTFDDFYCRYLGGKLSPGFELTVESLNFGTETIESMYDETLVAPYVVEGVLEAEQRGFSAVIVGCFSDPGLQASREIASIPVVGPGEASMLLALLLGDTFSILDVGTDRYRRYKPPRKVRELGLGSRFRSIWGTGVLVTELGQDSERIAQNILSVAKQVEREDEPDVLILGCTGLSTIADRISQALDVPVVDSSIAALRMAEALVKGGWTHSRKTYRPPSKKKRTMPGPYRLYAESQGTAG
jgi:allantoin racemase